MSARHINLEHIGFRTRIQITVFGRTFEILVCLPPLSIQIHWFIRPLRKGKRPFCVYPQTWFNARGSLSMGSSYAIRFYSSVEADRTLETSIKGSPPITNTTIGTGKYNWKLAKFYHFSRKTIKKHFLTVPFRVQTLYVI